MVLAAVAPGGTRDDVQSARASGVARRPSQQHQRAAARLTREALIQEPAEPLALQQVAQCGGLCLVSRHGAQQQCLERSRVAAQLGVTQQREDPRAQPSQCHRRQVAGDGARRSGGSKRSTVCRGHGRDGREVARHCRGQYPPTVPPPGQGDARVQQRGQGSVAATRRGHTTPEFVPDQALDGHAVAQVHAAGREQGDSLRPPDRHRVHDGRGRVRPAERLRGLREREPQVVGGDRRRAAVGAQRGERAVVTARRRDHQVPAGQVIQQLVQGCHLGPQPVHVVEEQQQRRRHAARRLQPVQDFARVARSIALGRVRPGRREVTEERALAEPWPRRDHAEACRRQLLQEGCAKAVPQHPSPTGSRHR
jgi:hypothetical protein